MRWLLPALCLCACRPAVQAPDTVEEMMVFGFVNFDGDDHVALLVDPLFPWVIDNLPQLDEGFAVNSLTAEDLVAAGVDRPDVDGILGALGVADYRSDLDTVAEGITHPDKQDIYEGTVRFDVLDQSDRDCFLDHRCDSYRFEVEDVSKVPVLGESTRTVFSELRWLEIEGQPPALAMRQLTPEPTEFSTQLLAIDQQYGFSMFQAQPEGGTRRVEAFWVDARVLGLELPEGYTVRLAVKRMQEAADDLDAFFSGETDGSSGGPG